MELAEVERQRLAKEWLEKALAEYPPQTAHFLGQESDPFRNPAGHLFSQQFAAVVNELTGSMDRARLSEALESIVRVRAVQELAASQAVGFLLLLKPLAVRRFAARREERATLEERIDQALLLAFDLYTQCKAKIFALQAAEGRRRVAQLERIYQESELR